MQRRDLLLATACLWALPRRGSATDMRLQLNPALMALHQRDPEAAQARLEALLEIIERGQPTEPPPSTRSIENLRDRALIDDNPLIREAWRIDPKAALDQLREIVAAGGGS